MPQIQCFVKQVIFIALTQIKQFNGMVGLALLTKIGLDSPSSTFDPHISHKLEI